ncbi:MAG TPA: YqgE/AlgH family protein [Bacteroidia bacterium]|nr:YqgE/AlgH family protein [Bacteroidia bacterium]
MKKKAFKPSQGSLLISEPFLLDSYFKRAVVLIGEHDQHGTIGFILNKPTDVKINDAVEDFPTFNVPLYFGGPVDTDTLFYIHTIGNKLEGAKEIVKGVWWGGNYDQLKLMIDTGQVKENQIRFYAGYSGWEPKQLDIEIKEKSWLLSAANTTFTFFSDPKVLWSQVLKSMGTEYAILANFPEDPSLN